MSDLEMLVIKLNANFFILSFLFAALCISMCVTVFELGSLGKDYYKNLQVNQSIDKSLSTIASTSAVFMQELTKGK